MLASTDLQRSITKMTLSLARAIDAKKHAADHYGLCEREIQYQYPLTGMTGSVPVETTITIPFDVHFVGDAGFARDSQLTAPQLRVGFERTLGPAGLICYAHVTQWLTDPDLAYIGAIVAVGVHQPAIASGGDGNAFNIVAHIAFQGYGAPWDPDGVYDAGGSNT